MSLKNKMFFATGAAIAAGLVTRKALHRQRFFDLREKVCVIAGGSRGLGLAIARVLASKGARLALLARDEEELRRAQAELRNRGTEVFIEKCDISDKAQVDHAIGAIRGQFGRIDCLLNVAGTISVGPHETMSLEDYEHALSCHFYGPLHTMLAVLPEFEERRSGRIVNVSSIGGKVAAPHLVPYSASKFALVGLSEGLRAEVAKYNVFVTTVCPGLMQTGSCRHANFKGDPEKEYSWFATADNIPGVSVSPDAMAKQIVRAMQFGEPELIYPLSASLGSRLNGLFPGFTSELSAMIEKILPRGRAREAIKGMNLKSTHVPRFIKSIDEQNAAAHNETATTR
jgi:short-subunit dehydrogenase